MNAALPAPDLSRARFVAVDWGTSSFRAWLMAADGTPLAESRSGDGMLHSIAASFGNVLQQHLAKLGAARYAGHHSRLDENAFAIPHDLTAMSSAGLTQVPLHGAERVCQLLLELT